MYRSYDGIYDLIGQLNVEGIIDVLSSIKCFLGIFSDLNECDKTKAALFTRVGPHLDWILQNTREACYCAK